MRLLWRVASPTPENREARNRDSSDYRWSDYLDNIWAIILSCRANAYLIILINHKCCLPFIINDDKNDCRRVKHPHIPQIFSPSLKTNFQELLSLMNLWSTQDKVRLQKVVKEQLKRHVGQVRGDIIIYCTAREKCQPTCTLACPVGTMSLISKQRQIRCCSLPVISCGPGTILTQLY